jgi:hypothetical protein
MFETGRLSIFTYFSPSEKRSAIQIGINRPVFLPELSVISGSRPVFPLSENICSKVPQIDRLPGPGEK